MVKGLVAGVKTLVLAFTLLRLEIHMGWLSGETLHRKPCFFQKHLRCLGSRLIPQTAFELNGVLNSR
jgi:hypothetical protein